MDPAAGSSPRCCSSLLAEHHVQTPGAQAADAFPASHRPLGSRAAFGAVQRDTEAGRHMSLLS